MVKTEITKLENGLQLILCEDKTKHSTYAELITNFGGLTKDFKIGDKKYHLIDGIAHLLEHTLIDTAACGNLLKEYNNNHVAFNGVTSKFTTSFYIDTVEDFYKHLRTLIETINTASFTESDLIELKKPIYEEIKKSDDRPYRKFHKKYTEMLLENTDFISNIGTIEDIRDVPYETVKLCHDTFYHPSNQVLLVSGNFDIDELKELVTKTYESLNKQKIDFEYIPLKENNTFKNKYGEVTDTRDDNLYNITYKIGLSDLSPEEGLKFSYYIHYFMKYNFADTSELFEELLSKEYTYFSIDTSLTKIYNYLYVDIGCYTTEHDYFKKRVEEIIKKRGIISEEKFTLLKKRDIVTQILKEENCGKILKAIYGNIVDHDYYECDKINDIEELNIEEYKEMLERMDFSNYMITVHKKEENKKEV